MAKKSNLKEDSKANVFLQSIWLICKFWGLFQGLANEIEALASDFTGNCQDPLGTKKSNICQIYVLKNFLSLPITFPILVNVNPYQIDIQNTQIIVFNFFPNKFGALPILQECPYSRGSPTQAGADSVV